MRPTSEPHYLGTKLRSGKVASILRNWTTGALNSIHLPPSARQRDNWANISLFSSLHGVKSSQHHRPLQSYVVSGVIGWQLF
jgi:hypothetical protein